MARGDTTRTPTGRRTNLIAVAIAVGVIAVVVRMTTGGDSADAERSAICDGASIEQIGRIDDERLTETSGLSSSSISDVLWAINDRGNDPELISLSASGDLIGQARLVDADNTDWEDLASIDLDGDAHLVVADIGDNDQDRDDMTLYVVGEPAAGADEATLRSELTLRYPDRPRNAEALLVHPDGTGAVVTRGDALVYLIDDVTATGTATMTPLGSIWDGAEIRAGAVNADGSLVALRTEAQIRVWELGAAGLDGLLDGPSCTVDLEQKKPEAMTFTGTNQLIATGEGDAEIFLIELGSP